MRQLLFLSLLVLGMALKTENPRALLELAVTPTVVVAKATLAGGYSRKFSPDMQSSTSFVSAKGCTGQCNADPKDDSKNFYDCAAQAECQKKTTWTTLTQTRVQLSQKNGAGVILKTGDVASTSVQTDSLSGSKVGMSLVTSFQDRSNLNSEMSLSFAPNVASGLMNRLSADKKVNKNQFAFYLSSSQNFVTLGDSFDYLSQGTRQTYTQSSTGNQWYTTITSIKLNNDDSMNKPLIDGKNIKWIYDVNVPGLNVPTDFMAKIIASYPTCQIKSSFLTCKCNGDLNKVPSLSVKFDGHDQYWTIQNSQFTTIQNVKDYDDKACVTTLFQSTGSDFVAGRVFLQYHYTVFSNSPNQITISQVNPVQMGSNQHDTGLVVTLLIIGLLFLILALLLLCCVCFQNIKEIPHYERRSLDQEPRVMNQMAKQPVNVQMPPVQKSVVYQQPQVVRQVVEMPQQSIIRQEPMMVSQQVIPGQVVSSQQVIPGQVVSSQQVIPGYSQQNIPGYSQQMMGSQAPVMMTSQQPVQMMGSNLASSQAQQILRSGSPMKSQLGQSIIRQ